MKNNEIFLKAQDKAIKNGFITFPEGFEFDLKLKSSNYDSTLFFRKNHPLISTIIFSHDFAKAFFDGAEYGWRVQLQTLVLEKEPLKYLEKFL